MSQQTTGRRIKNLFNPNSEEPFKLSRSKIEFFTECPRCFYLDRRLGIGRVQGPAFTLNSAVDHLLKKEFDFHRVRSSTHPLMKTYGIDAVPYKHEMMNEWRENFKGIQYLHRPTNFVITGAIDDVWESPKGELMIVDYKATSTSSAITLDTEYRQAYKRQMEIYQWLFRQSGFKVSDTGYFVYANGDKDKEAFDGKLEFGVEIIAYKGSDGWIEGVIRDAHKCLMGEMPPVKPDCPHCLYRSAAAKFENPKV
ncbi:MAG: PD-(D/E)XK nuclease family protein [Patescibacteria group bacterium]